MRAEPSERLDPETRQLWRVQGVITTLITFGIAWAVRAGARHIAGPDSPEGVGGPDSPPGILLDIVNVLPWIVLVALGVLLIGLLPGMRWRRWRYEITEGEVDLQRGTLFVTRTLVPLARIQHVDTQQGPLERFFGLATVVFHTAAGANRIPSLADNVAADVRDRIAALTRVNDEL